MLRTLVICANAELILLILALFYDVPTGIAAGMVGNRNGVLVVGVYVGALFVLGMAFDTLREAYLFPRGYKIPDKYYPEIRAALRNYWSDKTKDFPITRLRVLFSDLSVGAHVSGLVFPKIAISGGLFFGLLTNDWRSKAILAHEIGHIRNGDRWLFGVMVAVFGLSGLQAFDLLFMSAREAPSHLINISEGDKLPNSVRWAAIATHLIILVGILHWREYAADAVAVLITKSKYKYVDLLRSLEEPHVGNSKEPLSHSGSFFHPSIESRQKNLRTASMGLGPSTILERLWKAFVIVPPSLFFLALVFSGINDAAAFVIFLPLVLIGFIGLFVERIKRHVFVAPIEVAPPGDPLPQTRAGRNG
jgi:Zn-dependent protease with chaperone function